MLYFVSDGFTVVAIVVVKAAQQQKSLKGFLSCNGFQCLAIKFDTRLAVTWQNFKRFLAYFSHLRLIFTDVFLATHIKARKF